MMGRQVAPAKLFYDFDIESHVPAEHLLRQVDRFLELGDIRAQLRPFYSHLGRPSIDPELIVRMLLIGYLTGIRSERRLCEEVHLNLAYRWFCRLGLDGRVPDHSTFSKYRHGKFRDSDLLRLVFEGVVGRCISEGLVGGTGFAVDASLIMADVDKLNSSAQAQWDVAAIDPTEAPRAVREYLETLDDAAFGAATPVEPKYTSPTPTRPASGRPLRRDPRSSPTRTTTSSTPTTPSSWMWRRHGRSVRRRLARRAPWSIGSRRASG